MENFQYYNPQNMLNNSDEKLERFKAKLKGFENIKTVSEAREFAKKTFYIDKEINYISFDDALCVIIQSADKFKVCFESKTECICYNIVKK